MKKARALLTLQFDMTKRHLAFVCLLSFVSLLLVTNITRLNAFLIPTVVILIITCMSFHTKSNLTIGNSSNGFSWKYIRMLPWSRGELLFYQAISSIYRSIPFIFLFFTYYLFNERDSKAETMLSLSTTFKIALVVLLANISSSIQLIEKLIIFPRKEFQKTRTWISLVLFIRNLSIFWFLLIVFIFAISIQITDKVGDQSGAPWQLSCSDLFSFYVIIPATALLIFMNIKSTLKAWKDEKIGYQRTLWKVKRDVPIALAGLASFCGFAIFTIQSESKFYSGNKVIEAIYQDDFQMLVSEVKINPTLATKRNHVGLTPILATVLLNRTSEYEYLKKLNIKYSGETITDKDSMHFQKNIKFLSLESGNLDLIKKVFTDHPTVSNINQLTGQSPLHIAASKCQLPVVEFLLQYRLNPNIQDHNGDTALHLAAKEKKCFATIVALKEGGANFELENKKHERAAQVAYKYRSSPVEIHHYMHKHTRIPASGTIIEVGK